MAKRNKGKLLFSAHGKASGKSLIRRIIIGVSVVVMLLIALLLVGYYQLLSYLQGSDFRQKISTGATAALKADKVEILSNLRIDGSRVSVSGVNLANVKNIEQARIGRISTEVNRSALLGRRLHLRKLSVEEASLLIATKPAQPGRTAPVATSGKPASTARTSSAGNKGGFDKDAFKLDLFECKDADIHFTHKGKTYQLLGATVTAMPIPKFARDAWQLNAENARFHTPFSWLRDCSVKSATAVYHGKNLDLTDCNIMLTPGEMRAKAHYDLGQNRWTGDIQVNKGDIRRILNEDWKKRFSGEMYSRIVLTGANGGISSATGSLSVLNGVLEGLPFLSQLPLGSTHPYRTIPLDKADCQLLYPYNDDKVKNAWLFDKIHISAKRGLMIVHGHILVGEGGKLGGTLTIGLPERIANTLPVPRGQLVDQLFTAEGEEKGYLWVNMNLSGTIDDPQEDLSIRIATLVGRSLGKAVTEMPVSAAAGLFNTLLTTKKHAAEEESSSDTEDEGETEEGDAEEPRPIDPINEAAGAAGTIFRSLF